MAKPSPKIVTEYRNLIEKFGADSHQADAAAALMSSRGDTLHDDDILDVLRALHKTTPAHPENKPGRKTAIPDRTLSKNHHDKASFHPPDDSIVTLNADFEVEYWTTELSISEELLRQLVKEHDGSAKKIRAALGH